MTPAKFTPVDAARRAVLPAPIWVSPARRRVIDAAALLWCRDLAFPTVRVIASHLGCVPSSVLNGYAHHLDLQAMIMRLEWAQLDGGLRGESIDRLVFLADHACALAAADIALLRLPSFVVAARLAADPQLGSSAPGRASMAVHLLASLADAAGCGIRRPEVERILVASTCWDAQVAYGGRSDRRPRTW